MAAEPLATEPLAAELLAAEPLAEAPLAQTPLADTLADTATKCTTPPVATVANTSWVKFIL